MPHAFNGSFEACMMVSDLTLKSLRQPLQRKGWGLRVVRYWIFLELQPGHPTPSGQRCSTNHASVKAGSENISTASMRLMPLR